MTSLRHLALSTLLACSSLSTACEKKSTPPPKPLPDAATSRPADRSELPRRRLNDTHVHLNPPSYGVYLKLMDDIGIERAINLSGGSDAEARADNVAHADRTGGRLALFHNVDWSKIDDPKFAEKEAAALEESARLGFAGLKISKALGLGVENEEGDLLAVDDPRLDPIWSKAGELGFPVAIHTSDPKAFFEKPGPDNERHAELSLAPGWSFYGDEFPSRSELLAARDRMVARHPETTFILLHFANNPEDADYVDRLLSEHDNVLVDVAARIGEIGRHDASKMQKIFTRHADRVVFGTDLMLGVFPSGGGQMSYRLTLGSISETSPTLDDIARFYGEHRQYFESSGGAIDHPVPIQGDWKVHPVGLDDETLDLIYWKNSEREIFAPWLARRVANDVVATASK